jgi:hypothetical protein
VTPLAVTLVCDGCRWRAAAATPKSHEEHLRLAYDLGKAFLATERV